MHLFGKTLGLFIGLASGTGIVGVVVGLFIGHIIDKTLDFSVKINFTNQSRRQELFYRTTFQIVGHISKCKGRVTEIDIKNALNLMDHIQLSGEERKLAQQAFREGKHFKYPLRSKLRELHQICFDRFDLIRMFLDIQIQTALSDGLLHPKERKVLHILAEELGISQIQLEQFLQMIEREIDGVKSSATQNYGRYTSETFTELDEACKVLGVKISDDYVTIKRAWRRRMNEYHPDKLLAKGLPTNLMKIAQQKIQEIQKAWELIKKIRDFK
ncbi:MAG: co-chaperone DjlA [Candidatus Dasytiphilus stammeri]